MPVVSRGPYQANMSLSTGGGAVRLDPGSMTYGLRAAGDFANATVNVTSDALQRQKQADDAAWVSSATASGAKEWAERFSTAKQEAPEGADGFSPKIDADFQTWKLQAIKDAPSPEAAADASARFDRLGLSIFSDALDFEATSRRAKRMTDFNTGLNDLANAAFADPGKLPALVAQANGDLMAASSTWMLPTDTSELRAQIPGKLAEASLRGRLAQDPAAVLAALEGDGDAAVGALDPSRRTVLASAARGELNRRKIARNQERQGLKNRLVEVKSVVEAGFDPGNQAFEALEADIAAFQDPELASQSTALRQQLAFQGEIRTWTPALLQDWVNDERSQLNGSKGVSGAEAERIGLAEKVLTSMRSSIKQDPLSWAQRAGVVDVPPITFTGEGAAVSMQARAATALNLAEYYGTAPRLLTDEEESQLKAYLEGASADQQVALAFSLNQGFGQYASNVFQRIAGEDPLFAHAGGLASIGTAQAGSARDVLAGRQVLKAGNKVLPPAVDMNSWTADALAGAMSETPKTRGAVVEAAKAIYAAKALRLGLTPDDADEDLWNDSLQLAAGGAKDAAGEWRGGIGEWNGQSVLLPAGVRQTDLEDLLYNTIDEDFARLGDPVHGDGQAFKAEDISDARLVDFGHGQYLVDMSGSGIEFVRGDGPNGYFVLDVSRLGQVVMARTNGTETAAVAGKVGGQ